MRPSLRRRLALLLVALSGGALLSFGLLSYWLIRNAKLERLDTQIAQQLRRLGRPGLLNERSVPPNQPPRQPNPSPLSARERASTVSDRLARELGIADAAVAVQVVSPGAIAPVQSRHWPAGLTPPPLSALPGTQPPTRPGAPNPPTGNPFGRRLPQPEFDTQRASGQTWQLGTVAMPSGQVTIAVNLAALEQEMRAIRNVYGLAIPIVVLAIALGAWLLSGQALQPIQRLTEAMRGVTAAGLDRRLASDRLDVEFWELVEVFNAMLARLERSFQQASRFSGDAAHELKTPLAILQGELERALQEVEAGSPVQQRLGRLLDEVSRLSSIVRKLLLLSLADAGQMNVQRAAVDCSALVAEQVADLELLAPELAAECEIQPGLQVLGDRELLTQVVQNLLSNAIKYNLPDGWLRVQVQQSGNWVQVRCSNASIDLAAGDRQRIFDRFQRGDPARARQQVEGTGLGLSLAREVARAHGGELQLEPAVPGETSFLLSLPLPS